MGEKLVRAFCVLWLAAVTPVYGFLPLLVVSDFQFDDSMDLPVFVHRLEGDLLRAAYAILLADPAPGVTHIAHHQMLTDAQTWLLVSAVFFIAAVAARYLYRPSAARST